MSQAGMAKQLPQKLIDQMKHAGLPLAGTEPFVPKLTKNKRGDDIIQKRTVKAGARGLKVGWVDVLGRVWIRDWAHADLPDHWDVQLAGGESYIRIDDNGNILS